MDLFIAVEEARTEAATEAEGWLDAGVPDLR